MASACVNNIGVSPENFLDCPPYGWLSPRISFSRDDDSSSSSKLAGPLSSPVEHTSEEKADPEPFSGGDFEFRLHDPVTMLPADELFSDGKLVPLQLSSVKPSVNERTSLEIRSPEWTKSRRRTEMEISSTDPYLFSPKAPRCSSRWKDLLGLKKKLYQNNTTNSKTETTHKTTSSSFSSNSKSLKHFLHRSSKSSSSSSSSDASLSLPLLKDTDCESVSMSSRLSLSSSSSGHEHEDLPRLSLDSDKPNPNPICIHRNPNQTRMRLVKARPITSSENNSNSNSNKNQARVGRSPMRRATTSSGSGGGSGGGGEQHSRGVSVDSPRMNSSGKIVFQSLERSSSSPSSFNNGGGGNGPRFKQHGRGMERSYSYSANVRVTPVLNVPVCSLRGSSKSVSVFGFAQLFSSTATGGGTNRHQHSHNNSTRNRTKGG